MHIVTIEDPIEVLHKDELASINQREIGQDTTDFLSALRAALRQDPDVILIGEMRDTETVRAALQAAETGHLVLSTLHTQDATETVNRVIDFFPPHQQKQVRLTLAGTLRGIVCQRLVPTVDGGRVPALEILVNTGRVAERIIDEEKTSEIKDVVAEGGYYGMITFDQWLLKLIKEGKVSVEDAMQAVSSKHDFELAHAAGRHGTASAPRHAARAGTRPDRGGAGRGRGRIHRGADGRLGPRAPPARRARLRDRGDRADQARELHRHHDLR